MMLRLTLPLALAVFYMCLPGNYGASLQLFPYNETAIVMFMGNDLNLDGHLNRTEIRTTFAYYDANGDGIETRYEYTEYICGSSPSLYQLSHYLFDEYDLNGDHVLTELDYEALFDNMDQNRDDMIIPAEFIHYWEQVFPKYENVDLHLETLSHGPSSCH